MHKCKCKVQRGRWGKLEHQGRRPLISVSVSHRWRSSTTRLAIDLPMAWAVVLVARKARSVASQLPESRRIRLVYGREELGLIDLKNRHRVERRSRLSSWSVAASSERWSDPAWLGRVTGFRLPADGSGWAEMCSHWLIQLRHPLISLPSILLCRQP